MTLQECLRRVGEIAKASRDSEGAHSLEDELYYDVLEAIAQGTENPGALAAMALTARRIHFERWYA